MVEVSLRPLEYKDLELLLAWRSNPLIYDHFREQEGPLSWEEHEKWYATRPEERSDYVIEFRGRRVGVVTVTEENSVGIYIGEVTLWGEGVATTALEEVVSATDSTLSAEIHRDNQESRRLFEQCGFELIEEGEWLQYQCEP